MKAAGEVNGGCFLRKKHFFYRRSPIFPYAAPVNAIPRQPRRALDTSFLMDGQQLMWRNPTELRTRCVWFLTRELKISARKMAGLVKSRDVRRIYEESERTKLLRCLVKVALKLMPTYGVFGEKLEMRRIAQILSADQVVDLEYTYDDQYSRFKNSASGGSEVRNWFMDHIDIKEICPSRLMTLIHPKVFLCANKHGEREIIHEIDG
jgi:hypothetical protein